MKPTQIHAAIVDKNHIFSLSRIALCQQNNVVLTVARRILVVRNPDCQIRIFTGGFYRLQSARIVDIKPVNCTYRRNQTRNCLPLCLQFACLLALCFNSSNQLKQFSSSSSAVPVSRQQILFLCLFFIALAMMSKKLRLNLSL